jgi:pyruvate,water dikinase
VRALAAGELDHETFLARFGHRCRNEMELAQPRWSEDPAAVDRLVKRRPAVELPPSLRKLEAEIAALAPPPSTDAIWERIADEAKLTGPAHEAARTWADRLRTYLGLREAAKHYLLMGFAVIRRALVELDRRHHLNGGIFYLVPEELGHLIAGKDLSATISERRRRRRVELSLEVPAVLFGDDLEAIGRPLPPPEGAPLLEGVALSAGTAEGPALVLADPAADRPDGPYVLVCPSTDPAWVPLFAGARALVMETGGVLSHGAIVAREFGLPAVAGLPGVMRRIRTGQIVRVDGGRGTVAVVSQ